MKIQFLGTSGHHPTEQRHTSCVMLPEVGIVFDAGTGFFRVQEHVQTRELDVFLSHAHLDHVCGLTYFLVPMLKGIVDKVRVHANAATLETVQSHLLSSGLFPAPLNFEYLELDAEWQVAGGGRLTHRPLTHPGGSMGYRIDWPDKSLAFITDTTTSDSEKYFDFIKGVDLLIHECNFPDAMAEYTVPTGHSHSTAVGELARKASVGRLILTHFGPDQPQDDPIGIEGVRKIFPNTELARDPWTVEF
ncbi:MBL fold metallo-hydrolase [Thalassoroseus pseudoceratinae]|uniref:MBL fold metallo-hydrolase n=1 Tax=Thalassoroseus pseudoceratinae TaxID=2713176 RepID=UPI00142252BD|nr:MBL fold metallo-hydrolase [Thalassoroseus pseudoceratinae]